MKTNFCLQMHFHKSILLFCLGFVCVLGPLTFVIGQGPCRDTTITTITIIHVEGKKDKEVKTKTTSCIGECPKLYSGATSVGRWICESSGKGQKCACNRFEMASPNCIRPNNGAGKCEGKCPDLFKTPDDAQNGRNPYHGVCDPVSCLCVYKKK